ncbi:MAG: DUF721 domain-containing protein [Kiritimatiellales bacterium]|nr:DUF721 domain-containing protein [Kiritimatiellales bacterium]
MKPDGNRWDIDKMRYQMDKAPPPKRDVKSMGELLPEIMSAMDQPQDEAITVLCGAWEQLVGAQVAAYSKPGYLQERVLYVFVNHPGWITELQRMKRPLLQKIQQHYREMKIRQLRFEYSAGMKMQ